MDEHGDHEKTHQASGDDDQRNLDPGEIVAEQQNDARQRQQAARDEQDAADGHEHDGV